MITCNGKSLSAVLSLILKLHMISEKPRFLRRHFHIPGYNDFIFGLPYVKLIRVRRFIRRYGSPAERKSKYAPKSVNLT